MNLQLALAVQVARLLFTPLEEDQAVPWPHSAYASYAWLSVRHPARSGQTKTERSSGVQVSPAKHIVIPAGAAVWSLNQLSFQTHLQILFSHSEMLAFTTRNVDAYDTNTALTQMFAHTGLQYDFVNYKTLTVIPAAAHDHSDKDEAHAPPPRRRSLSHRNASVTLETDEECVCARSMFGEHLGPWCWQERTQQLIYRPDACLRPF